MEIVVSNKAIRNDSEFLYKEFNHDTIKKIRDTFGEIGITDEDIIQDTYYQFTHIGKHLQLFFISLDDDLETFIKVFVTDPDGETVIKIDEK